MTKSRMPILLLALAAPHLGAASPRSAEDAMTTYRETFKSPDELDCPKAGDDAEIIVCGRREEKERHRITMLPDGEPASRVPRLTTRLGPGEALIEAEQVARPDGLIDKRIMVRFRLPF